MHLSILCALGALSGVYSSTIGPVGEIFLSNKKVSPDGYSRRISRPAYPRSSKGQTFQLNVVDGLTDTSMPRASSIHWHGIFQDNTNYADGVSFVTQCPIVPGNSFLYQFSTPTQAGTFLYHSHFALQFCEGLRGSLVIYDPNDPFAHLYDVDNEDTVITLQDWNHFTTNNLPAIPNFSSILINGLGRFLGGPLSPLVVVSVKHGLRYRFRLVSLSCDPNFIFKTDGHNMTLIEADGGSLFRSQPKATITAFFFTPVLSSAISVLRITANRNSTNLLAETDLHPLVPTPVPEAHHVGGADVSINLEIGVDFSNPAAVKYTLAGAEPMLCYQRFIPPTSPALLQIRSHAQPAQDLLPTGSYYALPPNKAIEISIPGGTDGGVPHPFHLHGHAFHVVRSAGSSTYNWNNPVIRDTVSTGSAAAGDNVTFRFVTDNAGPWFLHCHIDYHLDIGLAVVLVEDIQTIQHEKVPAAWDKLCPMYDAANATALS
ncbi:yellow laccase [Mycena galericulata]|nr:yellow laccase [Mycena galericulata]